MPPVLFPKILVWASVGVALALLSACGKPPPPEPPVRAVKLMTVGLGPLQGQHEFAGEVRARVETRLGLRVGGKLVQRLGEVGQRVKAGQLLAVIDPQDFRLAEDAARAALDSAQTRRDLALADLARYQNLRAQNFISGAELERYESNARSAQAQWEQAKAQLATQANQANYTQLTAPVSGVITAVRAELGQVLSAGSTVFELAADGPRDAVFAVPEDKVQRVVVGGRADVRGWTSDRVLTGQVREVAAAADPVTRTFTVKVSLPSDQAPPLGSTVYVLPSALSMAGQPAIKLPTTALRLESGRTAVWVLDTASMTVQSRDVQVATADGNEAVIASGLSPGMQVVTAGVHVLSNGERVSVYQPPSASPAAPASAAR